jgi:hypothetical protein
VDILVWVDERLVYIPFVFVIGYLFLISVRKNSASAIYTVSGYGRTLKRRCAYKFGFNRGSKTTLLLLLNLRLFL